MIEIVYMTKNLKFKTIILKASLCDYSDACILLEGRITVAGQEANKVEIAADRNNTKICF